MGKKPAMSKIAMMVAAMSMMVGNFATTGAAKGLKHRHRNPIRNKYRGAARVPYCGGQQECERRVRQIARGIIPADQVLNR